MTTTNNQTAASRYRELASATRQTYKATSPSGMEWELRKITPQDYFLANQLPMQIAQKVAKNLETGKTEGEALASLPQDEQLAWLTFLQRLIRDAVVFPKIVEVAENPDEIDFILQEDFEFLVGLCMGGEAAIKAASFRRGLGADAVASTNSKKRRSKT